MATEVGSLKWVFNTKKNLDGSVQKRKARLVANGFDGESVSRFETVRMYLALSAHLNWPIYQLDVQSGTLEGDLHEDIYTSQPEGFVAQGMENRVCKLNKAVYGLKQAPLVWFTKLHSFFLQNGFQRTRNDPSLYTKKDCANRLLLLVCVFVDDVIYMGSSPSVVAEFKQSMMRVFRMEDLGLLHSLLGLEIKQGEGGVFVSQIKAAHHLLNQFNMINCKAVTTPMSFDENLQVDDGSDSIADGNSFTSLVEGLITLTRTRPDIAYAVGVVARSKHDPIQPFEAAKRILRYIAGTRDMGIWYSSYDEFDLVGFTGAGPFGDKRSSSGFVFNFGSGAVAWGSRERGPGIVSKSEAEYVGAARSACQAMWLRSVLADLGHQRKEATRIFCDNVDMTKNTLLHGRTEHIDMKLDFVRELVAAESISFKSCDTREQQADILTKVVSPDRHAGFRIRLGVRSY
ncbi:hypothetical protein SASPL_100033 [Salvia splendens]|uniref:Reverse transcriptase Ty1/copia-type domain-containing protein n=1 Tax=Salvia splendens TaxID=180675 RepID=A0A8X9ACV7_SALSN|nr:hypothetical protein SASPL_100033 [Salvia splendens]